MPYLFKPWCVFSINFKKTVFPLKMMNKSKILSSMCNVVHMMNASCFLVLIPKSDQLKPKSYFTPGLILSFVLYKSCQEFLNAYIPAQQNIHVFIWYTVAGQSQNHFFVCTMLLIKVLPLSHMQHYKL